MTHPSSASPTPPWHTLSGNEAATAFAVDPAAGLATDDVEHRLAHHGPNVIREERRRGPLRVFVTQFTDFMILVLIAAAVVSGLVGDLQDTLAIVAILVLNAAIGFAQEYRAERAIAALKQMAAAS